MLEEWIENQIRRWFRIEDSFCIGGKGDLVIRCPKCDCPHVYVKGAKHHDNPKTNANHVHGHIGHQSVAVIYMSCGWGHNFAMCAGEHKGGSSFWVTTKGIPQQGILDDFMFPEDSE